MFKDIFHLILVYPVSRPQLAWYFDNQAKLGMYFSILVGAVVAVIATYLSSNGISSAKKLTCSCSRAFWCFASPYLGERSNNSLLYYRA
jgi:hypothetical protein